MPPKKSVGPVRCQDCALRKECTLGRLGDEERARIEPQIRERIFHRGDVLLEEGKMSDFVRVVKMGTAFGYRRGLDGGSRPIGILSRGKAFGLFGLFDSPNQATAIALTMVRVCEIPTVALRNMCACGSKFLVSVSNSIVELFAAVSAWSEAMRLPGVVNQLAYVIVLLTEAAQASVVELPSHSALAELLGTRRETIARALATLESDGGIRRHERKRCEVHRSKLLARLSQGLQ